MTPSKADVERQMDSIRKGLKGSREEATKRCIEHKAWMAANWPAPIAKAVTAEMRKLFAQRFKA